MTSLESVKVATVELADGVTVDERFRAYVPLQRKVDGRKDWLVGLADGKEEVVLLRRRDASARCVAPEETADWTVAVQSRECVKSMSLKWLCRCLSVFCGDLCCLVSTCG